MRIENDVLIIDEHRIRLAEIHADTTVQVWKVPSEYRETGYFVSVVRMTEPVEIPACSFEDAEFLTELRYPAPMANRLKAARAERLDALNAQCEVELTELSRSYPPGELQSWAQQVKEAEALDKDPTSPAPLLTSISQSRGVPVDELARRVQEKANAYAEYSGGIIGKRQRLEDQLQQTTTLEEVRAIQW